jgi:hypothetical protein
VSSNVAYEDEMNEVALFMEALPAAVSSQPDPRLEGTLVPRLAATARASTLEAEGRESRKRVSAGSRPKRPRWALVARIAIAVGLIPLVLAGLAVAGVTVPGPARDAFDSVGITLPNQPGEHAKADEATGGSTGGNDVSDAAKTKAKGQGGNSAAAHEHALSQRAKARGKAKGRTRGKAIGLNDLPAPGQSGVTGPPAKSNAGGSAKSQSVRTTPTPPPHPFPGSNGRGGGRPG